MRRLRVGSQPLKLFSSHHKTMLRLITKGRAVRRGRGKKKTVWRITHTYAHSLKEKKKRNNETKSKLIEFIKKR